MTRLSNLRSKLFAHKLTSSISDNFEGSDQIDALLTQARLSYETMLSQSNGEKIDQRRSASRGQVIYRQGVTAPTAIVLVLDITSNRQHHGNLLQQINQIINHIITSCEQLGLECTILYPDEGEMREYTCEGLEQTISFINNTIKSIRLQPGTTGNPGEGTVFSLQLLYNEYYDHHAIIISDRLTWDSKQDANQVQHLLDTHQAVGYIRDYPSPIVRRGPLPEGLIWLK